MLINEAKWLGAAVQGLNLLEGSKILNFGSQSEDYNKDNIHISNYFLYPIRKKFQIKNLDLKNGKGIEIVGDLYNDEFLNSLKVYRFKCILLNNVLEHVDKIQDLCDRLVSILDKNGYIVFSGPKDYPIHYDPIDNGFRPNLYDVQNLFPNMIMIKGDEITDNTYSYYVLGSYKKAILTFARLITPFYKFNKWKTVVLPKFRYWNKHFIVTCVILQKK